MKGSLALTTALVLVLGSCHQNDFTEAVLAHIQSEAVTDSYQGESVDISSVAMNNTSETLSGGRYGASSREVKGLGDIDDRFKCAIVTHYKDANSTEITPIGKITIDFGTGCTDARGKKWKGMIVVNYKGKRFMPGSVMVVTFLDFYKNDVKVEGKHTITNITPSQQDYPKFQIVNSGTMIFPDGRTATREQKLTREWKKGSTPAEDKWVTEGGSTGTNKNGKNYEMKINSSLICSRACEISNKVFIPVQGIKTLTVDSKVITIDYGDGSCDNTLTITVNGKTKVETLTDAGR